MPVFKFKTSLNCGGCVAKIKKTFDENPSIKWWNVETDNPDKPLTVETDDLQPEHIVEALSKLGYRAELMQ